MCHFIKVGVSSLLKLKGIGHGKTKKVLVYVVLLLLQFHQFAFVQLSLDLISFFVSIVSFLHILNTSVLELGYAVLYTHLIQI